MTCLLGPTNNVIASCIFSFTSLSSYEKRVLYTEQILDGMEYTIQKIEVCIELPYLDFPPDDRRDPKLLVYINFIY